MQLLKENKLTYGYKQPTTYTYQFKDTKNSIKYLKKIKNITEFTTHIRKDYPDATNREIALLFAAIQYHSHNPTKRMIAVDTGRMTTREPTKLDYQRLGIIHRLAAFLFSKPACCVIQLCMTPS